LGVFVVRRKAQSFDVIAARHAADFADRLSMPPPATGVGLRDRLHEGTQAIVTLRP